MFSKVLIAGAVAAIVGCGSGGKTAQETYEEYDSKVKAGMTFKEERSYYTAEKLATVDKRLKARAEKTGKSVDELVATLQKFSRSMAKCSELMLVKKIDDTKKLTLVYNLKDVCNPGQEGQNSQTVTMVKEDGWKISEVHVKFTN